VARESYREHWREILAYSQPLMITGIIGALAGLCLPWVIRQRLPVEESAAYFILTRFSEISGYVGTTVNTMMFPMASERHERGQSTSRLLWQAALANALFGGAVVVALGVLGHWVLGLRPEWADYQKFSHLLWILALVRTLEMTAAAFWTNEMVCRRVGLIWGITALDTLMAVILYSLAGWGFFRPYLPPEVWTAVDRLGVCRLEFVVKFALVAQLLRLPVIAVVFWHHRRRASGSPAPA
jgi:hypothetical protein